MKAQSLPRRTAVKGKTRREPASHQHYATFSLELLLNDDNTVRRTRATHVQSGCGLTWSGWESDAVVKFVEVNSQLHLARNEEAPSKGQAGSEPNPLRSALITKDSAVKLVILGILLDDEPGYGQLVPQFRPYRLQLALEWGDDKPAGDAHLNYSALIQAKRLGNEKKLRAGGTDGVTLAGERALIDVPGEKLPPGIYRLSAAVTLRGKAARGRASELVLMQEGGLMNVY